MNEEMLLENMEVAKFVRSTRKRKSVENDQIEKHGHFSKSMKGLIALVVGGVLAS